MEQYYNLIFIILVTLSGLGFLMFYLEHRKVKLFKKSGKVRDEAISLITHEMRTGLTSTGWAIEMILSHYENVIKEDDKKILKSVVKSIHATTVHSINLLDISLLDAGKLSVSLEPMNLADVEKAIHEITEKYTIGAERKGVKLFSQIQVDKDKKIEVDIMRLRIILENLLENAFQYTVEGNEIKIIVENTEDKLNILIGDNGIGIPTKEQGKIFSEFYRASNARKKLSSGSGIGLYMCQQYIKAHNGTITFKSKEGEGTTFYISMPLKKMVQSI